MRFQTKFYTLLEVDMSLSSLAPYQRLGTRGINRKSMRQVPDYRRTDASKNNKVELVRKDNEKRILGPHDIRYIMSKYNIKEIPVGGSKELGTSGMVINRSGTNIYTLSR